MNIIKEGIKPKDRKYQLTCQTCATVFNIFEYEGTKSHDQREGDFISCKCPICDQIVNHQISPSQAMINAYWNR